MKLGFLARAKQVSIWNELTASTARNEYCTRSFRSNIFYLNKYISFLSGQSSGDDDSFGILDTNIANSTSRDFRFLLHFVLNLHEKSARNLWSDVNLPPLKLLPFLLEWNNIKLCYLKYNLDTSGKGNMRVNDGLTRLVSESSRFCTKDFFIC